MISMTLHRTTLALAIPLMLSACAPSSPKQQAAVPLPQPALSIQDLMVQMVDPAADALWESVSSETGPAGVSEQQPDTAAEWQALAQHASRLIEASRLLSADGLTVAHPGTTLEDAHVAGILNAAEIERKIAASAPLFKASAKELGDSARLALQAVEARDPARLLAAGARIDQACEHCHLVYWYPNAEQPTAKWPATLKGN